MPSSSALYIAGIEVIAETLGFLPSPFGFVPGAEGRFLAALAEVGVDPVVHPMHVRHNPSTPGTAASASGLLQIRHPGHSVSGTEPGAAALGPASAM